MSGTEPTLGGQAPHRARTRSFATRSRMAPRHHRALADWGDRYVLDVPRIGHSTEIAEGFRLDRRAAFGRCAPLIVEVGSGGGDCIVAAATAAPDTDFLAVEVWLPGVAQTVARCAERGVTNVRVVSADAAQALTRMLPDDSVRELWTFFPDPWPKARHHKRRLVQAPFAAAVATLLEPGGSWRLATDWADYAWQMRDVVEDCPGLRNPYEGRLAAPADDEHDPRGSHGGFAPRFERRVETRFERKGVAAGRVVRDVAAVRASGGPAAQAGTMARSALLSGNSPGR